MSKILLIAYYFPPIGGAGSQRPLKLARYLNGRGHTAVVLTGSGRTGEVWTPADPTLESEIPDDVTVLRVPGPEPSHPTGTRNRLERIARVESNWARWWKSGIAAAVEGLEGVDVVYTVMSPFASAEPSLAASRELGVGWIADLGDPWALDEMVVYPTEVHKRLEIRRMRRLLSTAAAVVTSTPEAAKRIVETFPELASRPVVAIPNGYDAADFQGDAVAPRDPAKFRIVHTGYLHTELGLQQQRRAKLQRLLGGATPGVEILSRSHVYLLEAIERLLAKDPTLRDRLEVHFAGVLSDTDRELAARCPVAILHGYLSHADSIALIRSADLLFLPMQNLPPGHRSTTVPGKTYEYLASGRTILGAVPEGDARDILTQAGHLVCEPTNAEAIANTIAAAISRAEAGATPRRDSAGTTDRFSRQVLTRTLAALVREVYEENGARGRRGRMSSQPRAKTRRLYLPR